MCVRRVRRDWWARWTTHVAWCHAIRSWAGTAHACRIRHALVKWQCTTLDWALTRAGRHRQQARNDVAPVAALATTPDVALCDAASPAAAPADAGADPVLDAIRRAERATAKHAPADMKRSLGESGEDVSEAPEWESRGPVKRTL